MVPMASNDTSEQPLALVTGGTGFVGHQLVPLLDEMVTEGLITIEDVHVVEYVHDTKQRT